MRTFLTEIANSEMNRLAILAYTGSILAETGQLSIMHTIEGTSQSSNMMIPGLYPLK